MLDECNVTQKERKLLMTNIAHRLTPQPVKIRAGQSLPLQASSPNNTVLKFFGTGFYGKNSHFPGKGDKGMTYVVAVLVQSKA